MIVLSHIVPHPKSAEPFPQGNYLVAKTAFEQQP